MTRHEEVENGDEKVTLTRDELKEEIRNEMRHEARRRILFSLVMYLVFFAVMLALPFLLLVGIAAKTGLYAVPVLSSWLYAPPSPTRIVTPLVGAGPDAILNSMAAKASYNETSGIVELSLSEQELTTIVRSSMEEASEDGSLPFPLKSVQVALLDDGVMELYAITEREGNEAPVILSVKPEVLNGEIVLKTENFLIGAFDVPDFLSDMALDAFTGSVTEGLESGLSGIGVLDGIAVEEGKLRVHLIPRQR